MPAAIAQEEKVSPPASRCMIWSHLAILLLLLVVYLGSAFTPALMDDADSSHAEAAREMLVRADYVTLHVNGVRYLEKAPLMYWLIAFCYRIFGVNEFAARLPIVLSLLLSALLAMRWAGRAFGERAGLYAALFVGSTTGFFLFTRILIPEALLSLFIAAALYFFLTAMEDARTSGAAFAWRWYAGYACVALGVLTKGLIALVFVGAAACGYLLLSGEWRSWREFRLAGGIALLLAIAAPWHLLAGFRNHGFFWFYFVNEHFLRFLGKRYPKDYNKLPARLYWSLHLAWFFPWSMYLPSVVRDLWHTKLPGLKPRPGADSTLTFGARTRLLCWIWGGSILIFFSLSTNQEYYTFPAYLPILMLLAAAIAGQECESGGRGLILIWSAAAVAAVSLTAGIALSAGLWSSRHLPYVADIGTVLAKHNLSNDTLSMSHILDLTGESFAALRLPALIAIVALIVGPLLALVLRLRRRHQAATWITACAMALLFVAAHIALVRFEPYMSSRQMAQSIARQAGPDDQVMIYGDQAYGSSLLFYLRRPIDLVNGRTTTMWFGSTFPDAPKIYLDDSGLLQAWNSKRRVFLFVSPYMRARVDSLLTEPKYVVTEESGKIVYSNRPGS